MGQVLRGDLDWIVMKALEKDRSRRYDTPSDFVTDIHRHLNNEPVSAVAPNLAYRFEKFFRRNKRAMATAAALSVVLVTASIISILLAIRATSAEAQARRVATSERLAKEAEAEQRELADLNAHEARHNLYLADMAAVGNALQEGRLDQCGMLLEKMDTQEWRGGS